MVPRVQLSPEIQLAQRLAGNEQVTRDRAVRKLRKYIVARSQRAAGWLVVGGVWGPPRGQGLAGGARGWRRSALGGFGTTLPGGLRAVLPSASLGICH